MQQRADDLKFKHKSKKNILTTDQKHTNHIANRLLVSRHLSLPKVFYFFANRTFLKPFFASRISGTFGFAPTHKASPSAKPKEPLFSQRTDMRLTEIKFQNLNCHFINNFTFVKHANQFNQNN